MTRNQSNRRSACFGGSPEHWGFVARRLLTSLVFMAALVQVAPLGLTVSRCVVDSIPDVSASESLSVDTHAVAYWATQPTAVARVTGEKSNESDPLGGSLATFVSTVANPSFLPRCKTHRDPSASRCESATLVNLNVRLQV